MKALEDMSTTEIAEYVDELAEGDSNDAEIDGLKAVVDELLARLG